MNPPVNTIPAARNPREVWEALLEGNRRFARDASIHPNIDASYRQTLLEGQRPRAAVLTCGDSRVPVELLFDVGMGDIFVVRTAGEVIDNGVMASLEYAVSTLKVEVLVVLGHEFCGAVAAAEDMIAGGDIPGGYQRVLIEQITPNILAARAAGHNSSADFERHHASATLDKICQLSPVIDQALQRGELAAIAARFQLSDGLVEKVNVKGVD